MTIQRAHIDSQCHRDKANKLNRVKNATILRTRVPNIISLLAIELLALFSLHSLLRPDRNSMQSSGRSRNGGSIMWKVLPHPPPIGFQEGSGLAMTHIGQDGQQEEEIWFAGGFPIDEGRIHIYDLKRGQWNRRSAPSLPWGLHHVFNGMFFCAKRSEVIILGGIRYDNKTHTPNNAALVLSLLKGNKSEWGPWSVVDLPVGGIIQCTSLDVDGVHWCYTGSNEFVKTPFRFFQFDPCTLSVLKWLPIPRVNTTHATLLLDEKHQLIHFLPGRPADTHAINKVFFFDLRMNIWLPEEVHIPYVPLDTRTPLQVRGKNVALLLGGQSAGAAQYVSDVVLQYHMDARKFQYVSDMPLGMFGSALVSVAADKYFVYGGSSGIGPKFLRLAWEVNFHDYLEGELRVGLTGESLSLVKASCGSIVVTTALQEAVKRIHRTANETLLSIPAKWCSTKDAVGAGGPQVPEVLTIDFLRDGFPHEVACEKRNSCLLTPSFVWAVHSA